MTRSGSLMRGVAARLSLLLLLAVQLIWVAPAHAAPTVSLTKEMAGETLFGDVTPVTLTASNSGDDGFNASFRDVLPPGTEVANASPPPSQVLPQGDGSTVVLWINVADLQNGTTASVSYDLVHAPGGTTTFGIGDTITNAASVYVADDVRQVPDFDPDTGTNTGDSAAEADTTATTTLVPFELTKEEPSEEGELLRGAHDHRTIVTLTIDNNLLEPTSDLAVVDLLPAGTEFLGCGTGDNSSGTETPGAAALNAGGPPAGLTDCVEPTTVTTVEVDPDDDGPLPTGVHTRVEWDAATLAAGTVAAGGQVVLRYVMAIPLRENVLFAAPAPADDGAQGRNLDNNTGPLTSDEQTWVNVATVTGTTDGTSYADDDTETVVAEDVSIHKRVDAADLGQGEGRTWTLFVETSEYATASDAVTVTDTLPDGLTPTGGSYDSAVENGDGTWTLTWNLGSVPAPSGDTTLTFTTTTDTDYTSTGGGAPVRSNDTLTNTTALAAPTATIVTDNDATTSSLSIPDASEATIEADGPTIDKVVATPASVGVPADCTAPGPGDWVEVADDVTPGDVVCWRIGLDFPPDTDTGSVVVRDFLPAGSTFVSQAPGGGDTGSGASFDGAAAADGVLEWTFAGDVDATGVRFEAVITATYDGAQEIGDLAGNLVKATYRNTAGDAFQLRDDASAEVANAELTVDKVVADVDDDATGDADTRQVVRNAVATFRVDVTNDGDRDALDVTLADTLPAGLDCTTVSSISDAGSCSGGVITWPAFDVAATATVSRSYDVTVPADVEPGDTFTNTAEVTAYEVATNVGAGTTTAYAPDDLRDTATLQVPDLVVAKSRTTSVTEGGNTAGQATIGETISYAVDVTIPEGTTLTGPAVLVDDVAARLGLDAGSVTAELAANGSTATLASDVTGQRIEVEVVGSGSDYLNVEGSGDDVLTLTFDAVVLDAAANTRGDQVPNVATFTDGSGLSESDQVNTRVVEPDIVVTKSTDDADGQVEPGQRVTWTVDVTARSGSNRSTAHDVVVVDTVPDTLTVLDAGGDPVADGDAVASGGLWDATARTITWTAAEVPALAALAPDDDVALAYATDLDDPLVAGGDTSNDATATTSSLATDAAGERTAASATNAGYSDSDSATVTAPNAAITKTVVPTDPTLGEVVSYTITATVPADVQLFDAALRDTLPDGLTYVATDSTTCTAGCPDAIDATELPADGQRLAWFVGDVAADPDVRTLEVVFRAQVDVDTDLSGDDLVNDATLVSNRTDRLVDGDVDAIGDLDAVTFDAQVGADATVTIAAPAGAIGDQVWLDLDRDGSRNGTEPGLAGLTVTLLDADGDVVTSTTTDGDGRYLFTDLPDGTFTVVVDPPADVERTADPDGGDDDRSTVTLARGDRSDLDQDFGYVGERSLGDEVWLDLDGDGERGAARETSAGGLAGVTVELLLDGDVVATTSTDASGGYLFEGLVDGDWTVRVDPATLPDGLVATTDGDGTATPNTSDVTLAGTDDRDQDFGYRGTTTLGDEVFLDLGRDGVRDAGEVMVEGVEVRLLDGDGNLAATTTTDAAGYAFEGVPPGDWTVVVVPPDGYDVTADRDGTPDGSATVTVVAGGPAVVDDVDVGLAGTGSIGDLVWVDLDEDGTRNGSEPGLGGVVLDLELDGVVVASATTDEGAYLFDNLPPGAYRVVVRDASLPPGFEPTNDPDDDGNDNEADVTLGDGEAVLDVDFGYDGEGQLGDRVWLDVDGDGVQDPGEPGIAGVTVELLDDGGDVVDTRVTDDSGGYVFGNLLGGDYTVRVDTSTLPDGVTQTADADGLATPDRSSLTLAEDGIDLAQDFGYVGGLSLTGTLWVDLDADEAVDTAADGDAVTEPRLDGVTVRLVDPATGAVVATTTTDADGGYVFDGLDPRRWRVEVDTATLPTGLEASFDADGVDSPAVLEVDLDADTGPQDLAWVGAHRLGDRVWYDVDADGVEQDGEPGIAGVVVELRDADGTLVATTTTDADGAYGFDVPDGEWTIMATGPALAGYEQTSDADGLDTPLSSTTTVAGADDLDQDVGLTGNASLRGTVFDDPGDDGVQGDGDAGRDGVVVRLLDPGTGDVVRETTTDGNGDYLFDNLVPGGWVVEVVAPDGTAFSPQDVGDDDTVDADVDPTTGRTPVVTLADGEDRSDVDAGLVELGSLGDLVFDDRDGDGVQDAGEPGIAGVTVTVLDADGDVVATTETDADGRWLVDGLRPGGYVVEVVAPDTVPTTRDAGDDDALDSDIGADGRTAVIDLGAGQDRADVDAGLRLLTSLAVRKEARDDLVASEEVTYDIEVVNEGPNPVTGGLEVTDEVPDGLTWLRVTSPGWDCRPGRGGDVVCTTPGPLAVGASLVLVLVFEVDADATGEIVNGVVVDALGVELEGGDQQPVGTVGAQSPAGEVRPQGSLPRTGLESPTLLVLAAVLVLLGAALVRRREVLG